MGQRHEEGLIFKSKLKNRSGYIKTTDLTPEIFAKIGFTPRGSVTRDGSYFANVRKNRSGSITKGGYSTGDYKVTNYD